MMTKIDFKLGDTFELLGQLLTDQTSGVPVDITGYTIRSQIRLNGQLIQSLTTSITDSANGRYKVSATPVQSSSWPSAACSLDIEFTSALGKVMSTDTITINCIADNTI